MAKITICFIEGCDKPKAARGYCSNHAYFFYKYGDALKRKKIPQRETQKYFLENIITYEGDECLDWPYNKRDGYGQMTLNGKRGAVPVFVCEHFHGPRPSKDHEAAHSCGKGHLGCCSPKHVRWRTRAENQQERKIHGTYQYGEKNPCAQLTEKQVREIRVLKGKFYQREIAEMFGTTRENIKAIHLGKSWKHLL